MERARWIDGRDGDVLRQPLARGRSTRVLGRALEVASWYSASTRAGLGGHDVGTTAHSSRSSPADLREHAREVEHRPAASVGGVGHEHRHDVFFPSTEWWRL